jgi:hypothetical protein
MLKHWMGLMSGIMFYSVLNETWSTYIPNRPIREIPDEGSNLVSEVLLQLGRIVEANEVLVQQIDVQWLSDRVVDCIAPDFVHQTEGQQGFNIEDEG